MPVTVVVVGTVEITCTVSEDKINVSTLTVVVTAAAVTVAYASIVMTIGDARTDAANKAAM